MSEKTLGFSGPKALHPLKEMASVAITVIVASVAIFGRLMLFGAPLDVSRA
ncbi:MAG: hypothetical protein ABIW32_04685 [Terrimesophilobacter sp.]